MNRNQKADLRGIGLESKTNFTSSETQMFSLSYSNTGLEATASFIERMIATGKTIRCFRCFSCKRNFAASRMATALVVCRECLKKTRESGQIARRNHLDRIINDVRKYLRGRLEA